MCADQRVSLERVRDAIEYARVCPGPRHRCPYLPTRTARHLALRIGPSQPGLYGSLLELNFRRSGSVIYRPACDGCQECRAIRVPVARFQSNRVQRRCSKKNCDLSIDIAPPAPTAEKARLYRSYINRRHGSDTDHPWLDFCRFVCESPVQTFEVSYRLANRLVAVGVIDVEPAALSTVYCYFDPDERARSLGVFNVLRMIEECRQRGIPQLYLGYYIRDCSKMNYKSGFRPHELLGTDGRWHES